MSNLRWVLEFTKAYKWRVAGVVVCMIIEGISFLGIVGFQKWIIDDVFIKGNYSLLEWLILIYFVSFIIYSLFFTIAAYVSYNNEMCFYRSLCQNLMKYLFQAPIGKFQTERTATYLNYFTNDSAQVAKMLGVTIPRMIQQLFMVAILITVVGLTSPFTLLLILLLSFAYIGLGKYFSPKLTNISKDIQNTKSDLLVVMEEGISSTREVISYNRSSWETERFNQSFNRYFLNVLKEGSLINKKIILSEPLRWIVILLVLASSGLALLEERISLGLFIVIYQYAFQLMDTVNQMFQNSVTIFSQAAYVERIKNVLESERVRDGKYMLEKSVEEIAFRNITFSYLNDKESIIKELSIELPIGKKIAFVGLSGGGKSTVGQLLMRFFDPNSGEIVVNGTNLNDIQRKDWNQRIDIVFQEPYLFPVSIKDNLLLGRQISDEKLEDVCKQIHIHDMIKQLPEGYNTHIGERGITLSGGQRQRLAIARALLSNTEILILDEATSALDHETERKVQQSIDTIRKGLTTVTIAHRLSTIINADIIYLFNNGAVIEKGTHDELMSFDSAYKKLYLMSRTSAAY